jgi:hypothetical protein
MLKWDSHSEIFKTRVMQAGIVEQLAAALTADLKRRGLLERTLIVRVIEFGPMPIFARERRWRRSRPRCFHLLTRGSRREERPQLCRARQFRRQGGSHPVEGCDFNATLLHLMGLDHECLSDYRNDLERRRTNMHRHVAKDVLVQGSVHLMS